MARNLPDLLFSEHDLRGTLANQARLMTEAVEEYPAAALTQEPEADLVKELEDRFRVQAPVLTEGAISADAEEAQVDVSGDFDRDTFGHGPHYVPGTRVTYYVPFSGDGGLFTCQPSQAHVQSSARGSGRQRTSIVVRAS
jgi:hypothetical protein